MPDLRSSIASLKLALDKMPRDNNSRPMHEALIVCFEAVAEDGDALKLAVSLLAMHAGEEKPMPWEQDIEIAAPRRKGWPKGKPRKPVEAVNG